MGQLQVYLAELLELSHKQEQALVEADIDDFQELGDRREEIITKMKEMNLKPEDLNENEKQTLQQINLLDQKNNQELGKQLELVKDELKKLNHYSRRDRTYIDPYSNMASGRYFDEQDTR